MKLPSYLAKSRHGIFYFRIVYLAGAKKLEKRWSLYTKNPIEAKNLALKPRAELNERLHAGKLDL
jgi:hypothetical protein